jgi:hypothetical protein
MALACLVTHSGVPWGFAAGLGTELDEPLKKKLDKQKCEPGSQLELLKAIGDASSCLFLLL